MFQSKILYEFDFITLFLALCLTALGVAALAGATQGTSADGLWITQAQWISLGLVCCVAIVFVDYRTLIRYAWVFYILGIIGLLLCFVPYLGVYRKGAYSWVKLGPLREFQPSEFAKITTLLLLAKIMGNRKEQWNGLLDLARPLFIGALPSILILKQPDLGTAIVFGPMTLIMMFVAGMPITYFLLLLSPALCLMGISHDSVMILIWIGIMGFLLLFSVIRRVPWTVWLPLLAISAISYAAVYQFGETVWDQLHEHQKERIVGYLNPELEKKGFNWNIFQSKVALGSGGFWGNGMGKGTQSKDGFLPEFEHDFVFPAMGEQFGFFGVAVLLGFFLLLMMRGLEIAAYSKTLAGSLISSGIVALFFSHITVNVGMVTGLLPVTGLPLTFISYGGSFMLVNMTALGLLINIRMRSDTEMMQDGFLANHSQMVLPKKLQSNDMWE